MNALELFRIRFEDIKQCPICEKEFIVELTHGDDEKPNKHYSCSHNNGCELIIYKHHSSDFSYSMQFIQGDYVIYASRDSYFRLYSKKGLDFWNEKIDINELNTIDLPFTLESFKIKAFSKEEFDALIIFS